MCIRDRYKIYKMNNELLEIWKKRGITPQGSVQPKAEEKKTAPSFIPTAPKPEPVKAAPFQPAAANPPAKVPPPTKHKTANDEMREIMEKRTAMQANPEPQKAAPKRTYLNEMQRVGDAMKNKPTFQPMEFSKKKTAAEEMLEIMQKRQAPPQPKEEEPPQEPDTPPKEEVPINQPSPKTTAEAKKLTASEEMKEIMKKKAAETIQAKEEPKRKTANEEMQEIMRLKGEKRTVLEPVKEKKPTSVEEMKQTLSAEQVHEKARAPVVPHEVREVAKIDQDEQMRKIKEQLESQIRFKAGDNLELKPKPPIEQVENRPLEAQEMAEIVDGAQEAEAKRKDSEGSDEPKDNPNVSHKPSGLFADD
eukprot:TRINITY_DN9919_c0_g1_i1.p1 TRINITY_DN9919_c0_g1~~TRINITY_DN9919_c0_g1_i1.p1  ORF type:complete len:362 (+),score=120.51 TRINITY_DN9919_c0_g1_i1:105-1190(+)